MKNIIILITLVILSIPKLKAQDTIPNYYCDCIDTNEIIGNKTAFFIDFELKYLKTTLKSLQLLDKKAYEAYFEKLYKKAFLKERRQSNLGDYSIHYPPNPTCYLLQKYLRIRIEETHQKYYYQRLADSLSINDNIDDLKYRVWFMPSFGNVRFLEIHLNSNELNGNKAIIYHLDNNIWEYESSFNVKIAEAEILQIDKEKWSKFIKKTTNANLTNLPQQADELEFRFHLKDGYSIVLQVYENGELVHLLDYQNPMKEGSERHNKIFRNFHLLTSEIFDWLPFKVADE